MPIRTSFQVCIGPFRSHFHVRQWQCRSRFVSFHFHMPALSPRDCGVSIGAEMTEFAEARKVAALIAAIAEPTRLRVLWQLAKEGPMHVGALADAVKVRMVNMSHHLGVMRQAGVLEDSKDGRKVVYKFRDGIFSNGDGNDILGTLQLGPFRVVLRANGEAPQLPKSRAKSKKSGK